MLLCSRSGVEILRSTCSRGPRISLLVSSLARHDTHHSIHRSALKYHPLICFFSEIVVCCQLRHEVSCYTDCGVSYIGYFEWEGHHCGLSPPIEARVLHKTNPRRKGPFNTEFQSNSDERAAAPNESSKSCLSWMWWGHWQTSSLSKFCHGPWVLCHCWQLHSQGAPNSKMCGLVVCRRHLFVKPLSRVLLLCGFACLPRAQQVPRFNLRGKH